MAVPAESTSFRRLWRTYGPLAASDLLMAASETAVNAGIARLADPAPSLAAYGAVLATCLLIESPVIMLLHAANAIATDREAFRRLRQFTLLLAGVLTALHAMLAFTGAFDRYFRDSLGLSGEVLALARPSFALMLPWTAAIAWRRLHQGLLIRHGHAAVASRGTVIRLATLAAVMLLAGGPGGQPGAVAGTAGLAAAVTAECAYVAWYAARWMRAHPDWARAPAAGTAGVVGGDGSNLTWRRLLAFYAPLALTSVTTFAARPVLTGLLARAVDAPVALAAWPVAWSTLLLFMLPMRTVEQVAIPYAGTPADGTVRRFARVTGLAGSGLLAVLAATPLMDGYLAAVVGVHGPVGTAVRAGLLAMLPVPWVVAVASCEAGRLVRSGRTVFVHLAALANVAALTLVAGLLRALVPTWPGTRIAAVSLIGAYLAEWTVLAAGAARVWARDRAPAPRGPGGQEPRGAPAAP